MRRCCTLLAAVAFAVMACSAHAQMDTPPEDYPGHSSLTLGIGAGAVRFPYYPGAAESRNLLLPFPYIVYHSRHLDVNRDMMRGKLLHSRRFSLEVTFGGAVSVDSSRTVERQGMPNLDWIGQAGPALRTHLWANTDGRTRLDLVLPARWVMSARALTIQHRGEVFVPQLGITRQTGDDFNGLNLNASLSALYGTRDYFQYIYGVAPQYATPERAAYRAPGGYGGYTLQLGFSLHRGDLVYGSFVSYSNLSAAAFVNSPLLRQRHETAFGFAVAWILKRRG